MPSPMLMLAVVVAFVLNGFYWHASGSNGADARWKAKITAENLTATQEARAKEQMWQGVVNETAKNYEIKLAVVRRNLDTALNGLRDRPERPATGSQATGTGQSCATGTSLCRQDSEFLVREAARADTLRAGLEACYAYVDAVK